MYVCLCNNVTDKAIRQSVRQGATCVGDLRDELGVASQCGQCHCVAQEVINTALDEESSFSLPYAAA